MNVAPGSHILLKSFGDGIFLVRCGVLVKPVNYAVPHSGFDAAVRLDSMLDQVRALGLTASEAVPGPEAGSAFTLLDEALPVCYLEVRNVEEGEMQELRDAVGREWPRASERFKARVEILSRHRAELQAT